MPGWKREVGRRIDDIVVRTVPDVQKAVRWNSPFYGNQGDGWFLSVHVFTRYVKVTFFRGTSLQPVPPGKSKHREVRYLDIHERSEEHTSELQSLMRISYAVFCLKKKKDVIQKQYKYTRRTSERP